MIGQSEPCENGNQQVKSEVGITDGRDSKQCNLPITHQLLLNRSRMCYAPLS